MDPSFRKQGKVIPFEAILSWWDVVVVIGPVKLDWLFLLSKCYEGTSSSGLGLGAGR